MRPLVLHSTTVTDTIEAERRALIFVNPGSHSPNTTDTIRASYRARHRLTLAVGALQILMPGERALCHRHPVFAIRFMIEGRGAYTAVAGRKMYMQPHDLVLTTQFAFHDHGNDVSRSSCLS